MSTNGSYREHPQSESMYVGIYILQSIVYLKQSVLLTPNSISIRSQMMESVSKEESPLHSPEPESAHSRHRYRDSSPIPRLDEEISQNNQSRRRSRRSPPPLLESEYRVDDIPELSSLISPWNRSQTEEDPTVIDLIKSITEKCCFCCTKSGCCHLADDEPVVHKEYRSEESWTDLSTKKGITQIKPSSNGHGDGLKSQNGVTFNEVDEVHSVEPLEPLEERLLKNGDLDIHDLSQGTRPRALTEKQLHDKMARMRCYCIPCMTYKFLIWQLVGLSVILQIFVFLIIGCVELTEDHILHWEARLAGKFFLGILWVAQLTVKVQLMLICVRKLWHLVFSEIIQLYSTSLLIFTGVYVTAYFFDESYNNDDSSPFQAFNLDDTQFANANYWERLVAFFYFSTSQQTLCGVCEIIPKSPPTMLLAGLQMFYGIVS